MDKRENNLIRGTGKSLLDKNGNIDINKIDLKSRSPIHTPWYLPGTPLIDLDWMRTLYELNYPDKRGVKPKADNK
jgi:hypothetical protein